MQALVVKTKDGNTVAFSIDINAKKSFDEFYEHEKHWNIPKEAMREFHSLIRKAAGMVEEVKVVEPPKVAKQEKDFPGKKI